MIFRRAQIGWRFHVRKSAAAAELLPTSFARANGRSAFQFKGSGPVKIAVQRSDEWAHVAALWFFIVAGKHVPGWMPA